MTGGSILIRIYNTDYIVILHISNAHMRHAMAILKTLLDIFLWPGNTFCAGIGASPQDDSGMLRGFINSIAWGIVAVIIMVLVL